MIFYQRLLAHCLSTTSVSKLILDEIQRQSSSNSRYLSLLKYEQLLPFGFARSCLCFSEIHLFLTTLEYFFINHAWRPIIFQFEIIINGLVSSFFHLNTYVMGIPPLYIFNFFSVRGSSLDVRIFDFESLILKTVPVLRGLKYSPLFLHIVPLELEGTKLTLCKVAV